MVQFHSEFCFESAASEVAGFCCRTETVRMISSLLMQLGFDWRETASATSGRKGTGRVNGDALNCLGFRCCLDAARVKDRKAAFLISLVMNCC